MKLFRRNGWGRTPDVEAFNSLSRRVSRVEHPEKVWTADDYEVQVTHRWQYGLIVLHGPGSQLLLTKAECKKLRKLLKEVEMEA